MAAPALVPVRWNQTILEWMPRYCQCCESRITDIVSTLDTTTVRVLVFCGHCHYLLLTFRTAAKPAPTRARRR